MGGIFHIRRLRGKAAEVQRSSPSQEDIQELQLRLQHLTKQISDIERTAAADKEDNLQLLSRITYLEAQVKSLKEGVN